MVNKMQLAKMFSMQWVSNYKVKLIGRGLKRDPDAGVPKRGKRSSWLGWVHSDHATELERTRYPSNCPNPFCQSCRTCLKTRICQILLACTIYFCAWHFLTDTSSTTNKSEWTWEACSWGRQESSRGRNWNIWEGGNYGWRPPWYEWLWSTSILAGGLPLALMGPEFFNSRFLGRENRFPLLWKIALDVLLIQASAAPCERVFSSNKETDSARRSDMASLKIEELQILKFDYWSRRLYWKGTICPWWIGGLHWRVMGRVGEFTSGNWCLTRTDALTCHVIFPLVPNFRLFSILFEYIRSFFFKKNLY